MSVTSTTTPVEDRPATEWPPLRIAACSWCCLANAIAAETSAEGDGTPDSSTIEVLVALDDASAAGSLDQAPVTVRVVTSVAQDVLAVPVDALLALADDSYVVERVETDGTTSQVPVETGAFADGRVEVTGELAEGDEVVVPE